MSAVRIRTVVVLPAPFGPQQAEHLAAGDLQVHVADRPQVAESPAKPDGAEHDAVGEGHPTSLTETSRVRAAAAP